MFKVTTLGELAAQGYLALGDGYRTKRSELGVPGLPILRVAEVLDGRIAPSYQDYVSRKYRSAMGEKVSQPDDVVLTTKGTVGRVAIIPEDVPEFVYSPQLCYFRLTPGAPLMGRYLYYWFKSSQFSSQAASRKNQTDMADYINLADIRSLSITLPPISIQEGVCGVLGSLDDKIALNDRIAEASHDLSLLYFKKTTQGSELVPLSSLVNPILGGTPSRTNLEYWNGDIPWASAKDVASSAFGTLIGTEERVTAKAAQETKAKPVPAGSVILTARGTVGAVARVAQPVAFNQSCYAFVPDCLPPGVLYLAIHFAAQSMLSVAHGTVFSTVNMKTFDHIMIPRLDSVEVSALEGQVAPLLDLVTACIRENQSLAALRDVLLPGLMSGAIRVREAEAMVEEAG